MIIKKLEPPKLPPETKNDELAFRRELAKRVSNPKISQYTADPSDVLPGDIWIRFTGGVYTFCYRTDAGTTVRVILA